MKKTKIKFLAIMTMFLMLVNNVKSQVTIIQGTGCQVEVEVEYYDSPNWVPAAFISFMANGPSAFVPAPTGFTPTDVRVRHTQIGGSAATGAWVYYIGGSNQEQANCNMPNNDMCGCIDNYMTFTGSSSNWSFLWY